MSVLCRKPRCTRDVHYVVRASSTQHELLVCPDHQRWAKDCIEQDFPGRTVECDLAATRERLPGISVAGNDDVDGW